MKKRPWIPIAVVLLVLLGATIAVGSVVRSRLAEAELVLEPLMQSEIVETLEGDAFPVPECDDANDFPEQFGEFYAAVGGDEVSMTDPSFDSFLLESAVARLASGKHQLLLRARSGSGVWCLDEAVFTTEK